MYPFLVSLLVCRYVIIYSLTVMGSFPDVTSVVRKTVNEGQDVTLRCSPPMSVPPPVITWGLQESDTGPMGAIITIHTDKRIQIDENGRQGRP